MQQDYGQPGTAQTLYKDGKPLPIPREPVADRRQAAPVVHATTSWAATRCVPHLIGKDVDATGNVAPYPELSTFSFSSADHKSPYSRGFWTNVERKGAYAQQARLAWDRLRNVLEPDVSGPDAAAAGQPRAARDHRRQHRQRPRLPHRLPRGAHRLAGRARLSISPPATSCRSRTRSGSAPRCGVGNLTTEEMTDPNFPRLRLEAPRRLGRSLRRSSSRPWRRWATAARRWISPTPRRSTW